MNNVAIASMIALYVFSFANVMIAWPYNDDCITPGTEKNPIANRPCLPLLNKIVNYTQQVINVGLSVANIVIGVTFVVKLMATKIPNVVRLNQFFTNYITTTIIDNLECSLSC